METGDYIDALTTEGRLLCEAAAHAGLGASVPSCPGWRVRDLLAHIGYVHRWATRYVGEAVASRVDRTDEAGVLASGPPDGELVDWVREGHGALVQALRAAPSDLRCWTFLPAPSPLAFWCRRQAHETAVHRVDAQLAAGGPVTPVEPDFAADGVEEVLFGFFRPGTDPPPGGATWTLGLVATDHDSAWGVRVHPDFCDRLDGPDGCEVVVRAPVDDLYRLVWNRRSHDGLEVLGTRERLGGWDRFSAITWS